MKQILTLLMATTLLGSSTLFAQSREETRRVILGSPSDNGTYDNRRDRDDVYDRDNDGRYSRNNKTNRRYEAEQINREYDNKIRSIRNNRYLSYDEKERMIKQLERDRRQQLARVNRNFNNRDRRYNDNARYAKKNNGKHKGWYKKRD